MPAEEKESAKATQTVSFPAGNETESKQEPTETAKETAAPVRTEAETSSEATETKSGKTPLPSEKPKEETAPQKETPKSEKPASQTPKAENLQTEPTPTQPSAETKPVQEGTVSQPEKEPEPEPTAPSEPVKPKSIYDYEFDVEAIRQELLTIGVGMGLEIDASLTPDSSSWGNPVTASKDFQGASLERSLKDYVRSMPDLITAYGGTPIQYFTIYEESLGGGSYRFYFLY